MTVDPPPNASEVAVGRAHCHIVHDPTATSEAFGSILVKAVDIAVITLSPTLQQNAHPC